MGCTSDRPDERMVSVTLRVPQSMLDELTAAAKSYHISRSDYVRRKLADSYTRPRERPPWA